MSLTENTQPLTEETTAARCPVHHAPMPTKKSASPGIANGAAVERNSSGTWHIRGFEEARAILRSGDTRQAGFKAELVTAGKGITRRPILYQEGKEHQEQRTKTARFFTPKTVSTRYREFMERLSDRIIARIRQRRRVDLSQLSMRLAVQVAAQVVGLTNSRRAGLDRRLDAFFSQTVVTRHRGFLAGLMQLVNMRRLLAFYWFDVRPAIHARRKQPQEDVISHLLAQNYNDSEILTECVTYGAAGMVTTREFICMAAWHLLEHPDLRERYLAAPEEERIAILHETLRLEPVVGHLYRRATANITLQSEGRSLTIPEGALLDIDIEMANLDESIVGTNPRELCPARPLKGEKVQPMLMSFGDGAHRCPGAYLAIQETDIFLQRLLALEGLRIKRAPTLTWNELTAGYELREFILELDPESTQITK